MLISLFLKEAQIKEPKLYTNDNGNNFVAFDTTDGVSFYIHDMETAVKLMNVALASAKLLLDAQKAVKEETEGTSDVV
jgi:hypothetical protein